MIAIINYDIGNVKSIANSLSKLNLDFVLTSDRDIILNADKVILPGVGAFSKGMENLLTNNLINTIEDFVLTGKPLLGICLGMQMLLDQSEEFGITNGLGLIKGTVKKMPIQTNSKIKLPHVGWNKINIVDPASWNKSLLKATKNEAEVYFVHSFVAIPENKNDILATSFYGGNHFCAAIKHNNITGVQFHPEKSGETGLNILSNF